MLTSIVVHAGNPELQDRAAIFEIGHRVVFALADGAGGIAGGALAAEFFTRIVRESAASLTTPASNCSAGSIKIWLRGLNVARQPGLLQLLSRTGSAARVSGIRWRGLSVATNGLSLRVDRSENRFSAAALLWRGRLPDHRAKGRLFLPPTVCGNMRDLN